jgi:hypothetical protein
MPSPSRAIASAAKESPRLRHFLGAVAFLSKTGPMQPSPGHARACVCAGGCVCVVFVCGCVV